MSLSVERISSLLWCRCLPHRTLLYSHLVVAGFSMLTQYRCRSSSVRSKNFDTKRPKNRAQVKKKVYTSSLNPLFIWVIILRTLAGKLSKVLGQSESMEIKFKTKTKTKPSKSLLSDKSSQVLTSTLSTFHYAFQDKSRNECFKKPHLLQESTPSSHLSKPWFNHFYFKCTCMLRTEYPRQCLTQ